MARSDYLEQGNSQQRDQLRALPGFGRIERFAWGVGVASNPSATDGDRRNANAHGQVRVGRPLIQPDRQCQRVQCRDRRFDDPASPDSVRPAGRFPTRSIATVSASWLLRRPFSSSSARRTDAWNPASSCLSAAVVRRSKVYFHPRLARDRVDGSPAADSADAERSPWNGRHLES